MFLIISSFVFLFIFGFLVSFSSLKRFLILLITSSFNSFCICSVFFIFSKYKRAFLLLNFYIKKVAKMRIFSLPFLIFEVSFSYLEWLRQVTGLHLLFGTSFPSLAVCLSVYSPYFSVYETDCLSL